MSNTPVVLISSHSKANDIWYITGYFLKKYWKANLLITLGANGESKEEFVPKGWRYINNGQDVSFSKSLMSYLNGIDEKYIILMLDDFIILDIVDNKLIDKAYDFIRNRNGVYLRLIPNPKGDTKINDDFSKIDIKSQVPYATSLQMSIWNKEFLMQLLSYNFSPWEFETRAGKTSESLKNSEKFFVTNYPFIKYTHFVEKGRYYPFIKDLIEKEGLEKLSDREVISEDELKKLSDTFLKKQIRKLIPAKYMNKIRKLFGKNQL